MKKIIKAKKRVTKVPFSKLSTQKKRISICKDVLSLIKNGKILIDTGNYCKIRSSEDNIGKQINTLLNKDQLSCEVCAKGALFMAHIDKTNHLKLNNTFESFGNYDTVSRLQGIFDEDNLHLIETAFEIGNVFQGNLSYDDIDKAKQFGDQYNDPEERLIAIINNMLANKGIFIP